MLLEPPVFALVPAAGLGRRFDPRHPKQLAAVAGRSVVAWSVRRLVEAGVAEVVVALPSLEDALEAGLEPSNRLRVVTGGATRQQSVARCLVASSAGPDDLVLVHDGARPAVAPADVRAVVSAASVLGAAILGRPMSDTVKRIGRSGRVETTLARDDLFRAETPQVFRRHLLERALDAASDEGVDGTDEAGLVERFLDSPIAAVAAASPNPKVTRPGDLVHVGVLLGAGREEAGVELRIGQGYDIHRLVAGRPLVLGGVEIPAPRGLEGVSDADVLLHALGDALLGAAGLGDLGAHFPPDDPRWRGADSAGLLRTIRELVEADGWRVVNCDATIVAERPHLAPHRQAMRERVAALLGLDVGCVGIKATTNEGLGPEGLEEGISARAVALLSRP